jgi:DUF971 family protein
LSNEAPSAPPPVPTEIRLDAAHRQLTVGYGDNQSFTLSAEFLRVHSPSADVAGHGEGGTLQLNKQDVTISDIEPVGNYAVRLVFSDGHNTGLYTWKVLHRLGSDQESLWADYRARVAEAIASGVDVNATAPARGGGCQSQGHQH